MARANCTAPEDTAVDSQGRVYAGLADGRVVRLDASGKVETFVDTGGRPLGMDFDAAGNLILADAWKGLLRIDPQGKVETLATEADGVPFAFTDDLDIASDGRIYFSDASSKFHQPDYILDLLEARPRPPAALRPVHRQDRGAAQGPVLRQWRGTLGKRGLRTGQRDLPLSHHPLLAERREGRPARGVHRQPAGLAGQPPGRPQGTFWVALPTRARPTPTSSTGIPG